MATVHVWLYCKTAIHVRIFRVKLDINSIEARWHLMHGDWKNDTNQIWACLHYLTSVLINLLFEILLHLPYGGTIFFKITCFFYTFVILFMFENAHLLQTLTCSKLFYHWDSSELNPLQVLSSVLKEQGIGVLVREIKNLEPPWSFAGSTLRGTSVGHLSGGFETSHRMRLR